VNQARVICDLNVATGHVTRRRLATKTFLNTKDFGVWRGGVI
jgi:hypothetical protein